MTNLFFSNKIQKHADHMMKFSSITPVKLTSWNDDQSGSLLSFTIQRHFKY